MLGPSYPETRPCWPPIDSTCVVLCVVSFLDGAAQQQMNAASFAGRSCNWFMRAVVPVTQKPGKKFFPLFKPKSVETVPRLERSSTEILLTKLDKTKVKFSVPETVKKEENRWNQLAAVAKIALSMAKPEKAGHTITVTKKEELEITDTTQKAEKDRTNFLLSKPERAETQTVSTRTDEKFETKTKVKTAFLWKTSDTKLCCPFAFQVSPFYS